MQLTDKIYKGVLALLFLFVFIYLLLRVIYTEPLHDEIATYILYIYHGDYIGENIQWDANNHLLNSFIGHQTYKLFGDNMVLFRLPNLIAFIIYFFGTIKLTKNFTTPFLKISSVIALNTIPFIIEYFGYTRGYGLSLGFFVWGIHFFIHYQKTFQLKQLLLCYLFLLLAVSANLTIVNSALLILGINTTSPFFGREKMTLSFKIKEWGLHLFCVVGLLPFIYFGLLLRAKGALYYGGLDGLWDGTGKSLSTLIFFTDSSVVQYIIILFFIISSFLFFRFLKKFSFKKWLQQPFVLLITVLFGNIIGILILANFMGVNYPEDRTAMYLVILSLLVLFYLLENFKLGKWLQLSLLFFPISFISQLSLDTSVFSPEQRMNADFYQTVKSKIEPHHSIMIYPTMFWNWTYMESHQKQRSSVTQTNDPFSYLSDLILTREEILQNQIVPSFYDTIATHKPSGYIALKRSVPLSKTRITQVTSSAISTNQEYYNLAEFNGEKIIGKDIQLSIKGHLKTDDVQNKIHLSVQLVNEKGEALRYYYYSFEACYQNEKMDADFNHHFVIDKIDAQEKEIKVYIWNRAKQPFEFSESTIELFELKTVENESR